MDLVSSTVIGVFGSSTWIALKYWKDGFFPGVWKSIARLMLGGAASFLWTSMGFPDSTNSFLVGFAAPVFIEHIYEGIIRNKKQK